MKTFLLTTFSLFALTAVGIAQNCQVATSIPADLQKVGSGSATAQTDGVTTVRGGQAVYVSIKNVNVLGVAYNLTIEQDTTPPVPNCAYKALLPPQTSVILWGAIFADPPISWKITVSVGEESDAGVLTYEIYSQAGGANNRNKKKKKK